MPLDLTNKRFGYLVLIKRAPNKGTRTAWLCQCDCGETVVRALQDLQRGDTVSCGCRRREVNAKRNRLRTTHGHTVDGKPSPTWETWHSMKERCYNPNYSRYERYGGRGITVCARWRNSFASFLTDMGERPPGLTLERIENDGNYEPGNCRWATSKEQANNRRNNIRVEYEGREMTLKACADAAGVNYKLLYKRYKRGQPLARAISSLRRREHS